MTRCIGSPAIATAVRTVTLSSSWSTERARDTAGCGGPRLDPPGVAVHLIQLALVLVYQAWTYYVFRKRVSASDFRPPAPPPGVAPEPERLARRSSRPPGELSRAARRGGDAAAAEDAIR